MKECAKETLDGLIRHELEQYANSLLVSAIRTGTSRDATEIAEALREAVEASHQRISETLDGELSGNIGKTAGRRGAKDSSTVESGMIS